MRGHEQQQHAARPGHNKYTRASMVNPDGACGVVGLKKEGGGLIIVTPKPSRGSSSRRAAAASGGRGPIYRQFCNESKTRREKCDAIGPPHLMAVRRVGQPARPAFAASLLRANPGPRAAAARRLARERGPQYAICHRPGIGGSTDPFRRHFPAEWLWQGDFERLTPVGWGIICLGGIVRAGSMGTAGAAAIYSVRTLRSEGQSNIIDRIDRVSAAFQTRLA